MRREKKGRKREAGRVSRLTSDEKEQETRVQMLLEQVKSQKEDDSFEGFDD